MEEGAAGERDFSPPLGKTNPHHSRLVRAGGGGGGVEERHGGVGWPGWSRWWLGAAASKIHRNHTARLHRRSRHLPPPNRNETARVKHPILLPRSGSCRCHPPKYQPRRSVSRLLAPCSIADNRRETPIISNFALSPRATPSIVVVVAVVARKEVSLRPRSVSSQRGSRKIVFFFFSFSFHSTVGDRRRANREEI